MCWRSARSSAGFVFKDYFIGHEFKEFWGSVARRERDHARHASTCRPGCSGRPSSPWCWASCWPSCSTSATPRCRSKLAASTGRVYQFLLNKWYFDELYDLIFVQPAMWLGRFFWKKGDGAVIDGFGPDGVVARRRRCHQRRRPAADRLCLSLCLRHADRRGGIVSWFLFGGAH